MSSSAQKTLLHAFEIGVLPMPGTSSKVLFIGAQPGLALPEGFGAKPLLVQGFRPYHQALVDAGFDIHPQVSGDGYDLAMVLCGRHRGWNEAAIAEALLITRPGCTVVVAGAKEDGIVAVRKRFAAVLAIEAGLPKHHGLAFWMTRPDALPAAVVQMWQSGRPAENVAGYVAAPGMFSHDVVDAGSELLAAHLPTTLAGDIADFCAGWGFLSAHVARHCERVESIDLYEADHASLEAAKRNLGGFSAKRPGFFWCDLTREVVGRRYDAIVMNPPFHYGRAAEPAIGQQLIRTAAAALKPGGALHMVANRNLPYEAVLSGAFRQVARAGEGDGYKVLKAMR